MTHSIRLRGAGVLALTGLLAACGDAYYVRGALVDTAPSATPIPAASIGASSDAQGLTPLIGAAAACDVQVLPLHYRTVGVRGENATASGVMLIPSGTAAACKGPFPVLSYNRGTDINQKRTLASPTDAETGVLTAFFAAQGNVVVATDYLGYGKSDYGFHPYLHADSQATATIDALRAARELAGQRGVKLSGEVMLYGYSQGGHASMATHRAIESDSALASEFKLVAVAHGTAPAALKTAISVNPTVPGVSGQFFVPFFVTAWQKVYGDIYSSNSQVFNPPYLSHIDKLFPGEDTFKTALEGGKLPASPPPAWFTELFTQSFRDGIATNAALLKAAERNDFSASGWTPKTPTLLCTGSKDPAVPYATAQKVIETKWAAQIGTGLVQVQDVDPLVESVMLPALCTQADPMQKEMCRLEKYHGELAPPLCLSAVKQFFAAVRATAP